MQIVHGRVPEPALIGRQPDKSGVGRHPLGACIAGEAFIAPGGFSQDPYAFRLACLFEEDDVTFRFVQGGRGLGLPFGRLQVDLGHGQALLGLCLRDFLGGLSVYLLLTLTDLGLASIFAAVPSARSFSC